MTVSDKHFSLVLQGPLYYAQMRLKVQATHTLVPYLKTKLEATWGQYYKTILCVIYNCL